MKKTDELQTRQAQLGQSLVNVAREGRFDFDDLTREIRFHDQKLNFTTPKDGELYGR